MGMVVVLVEAFWQGKKTSDTNGEGEKSDNRHSPPYAFLL